jgi:hypothetical protein
VKKYNIVLLALTIMTFSNYGHSENITILIKNNNTTAISVSFTGSGSTSILPGNQMPLNYTGPTYATAIGCQEVLQGTACIFPESAMAIDSKTLVVGAECNLSGDPWSRNLTLTCG